MLVDDSWILGDIEKLIERRIAVRLRHAFDLSRHQPADVERLPTRGRMRDDDRLPLVAHPAEIDRVDVETATAPSDTQE